MKFKIAICFLITLYSSILHSESVLPSHCKPNEFTYLNAKMSKVHHGGAKGGYELIENGKVLSMCVDKKSEPLTRISYRYGTIGKVEIEVNGTTSNKFNIFSTSNRPGEPSVNSNVFFFKVKNFTYYVTEGTGQASGIGLLVYKDKKQVAYLFSGNERGVNYESGFESDLVDINFSVANSPIFVYKKPAHPIY